MPQAKKFDTIGKAQEDISRLNSWMIGVIIVLAVSFAGVFVGVGASISFIFWGALN